MNINFTLPDFVTGYPIYKYIYDTLGLENIWKENVAIDSIYGSFPSMIWNGGTLDLSPKLGMDRINRFKEYYESKNVSLRFTLTNTLLKEENYSDEYCNNIISLFNNGRHQILVAEPKFEEYLRSNYKNYKYCKSIVGTKNVDYSIGYYITVLKWCRNNNWRYLSELPVEVRNNLEILVDQPCNPECPRIYEHYEAYAKAQILGEDSEECECIYDNVYPNRSLLSNKYYVSPEGISKYLDLGINHFKCSGRYDIFCIVDSIVDYLILPEYSKDVKNTLISEYISMIEDEVI